MRGLPQFEVDCGVPIGRDDTVILTFNHTSLHAHVLVSNQPDVMCDVM
jgi:hypothetical protein